MHVQIIESQKPTVKSRETSLTENKANSVWLKQELPMCLRVFWVVLVVFYMLQLNILHIFGQTRKGWMKLFLPKRPCKIWQQSPKTLWNNILCSDETKHEFLFSTIPKMYVLNKQHNTAPHQKSTTPKLKHGALGLLKLNFCQGRKMYEQKLVSFYRKPSGFCWKA